ncbi:10916_t:CDS:2, partial [Gigaspora margarita]
MVCNPWKITVDGQLRQPGHKNIPLHTTATTPATTTSTITTPASSNTTGRQRPEVNIDPQRSWNEQFNNTLAKVTQPDNSHSSTSQASTSTSHTASSQHLHRSTNTPQPRTTEQADQDIQTTALTNQAIPASAATKLPVLKSGSRKYPSIDYTQDHINELCLQQSFHAVMAYDEDRRVTAVTNRNSTLLDRDTEVEGRNFDATTVKKQRLNAYRTTRLDTEWPDGRQLCINWNRRF